jgi:hypothetical protein
LPSDDEVFSSSPSPSSPDGISFLKTFKEIPGKANPQILSRSSLSFLSLSWKLWVDSFASVDEISKEELSWASSLSTEDGSVLSSLVLNE